MEPQKTKKKWTMKMFESRERKLVLSSAFAVLFTAGCAVGPNYQRPSALGTNNPMPAAFAGIEALYSEPVFVMAIVLVLVLFVVAAAGVSLHAPAFEAPDEPHHYDYARWVASHGKLPDKVPENPNEWETLDWYNDQWIQPPLYYMAMSPIVSAARARTSGALWTASTRSM